MGSSPLAGERGRYAVTSFKGANQALEALADRLDSGDVAGGLAGIVGGKSINTLAAPFLTASVPASSSLDVDIFLGVANVDLFDFAQLQVVPSAAISSYDLDLFLKNDFAGLSHYNAPGITLGVTPFNDFDFGQPDDNALGQMHLRITNNDGALAATFTVGVRATVGIS